MPSQFMKYTVPSILAIGLAAFAISACSGDSGDSGASELAKFAPADAPVFVEGAVQPESDVAANVDSITETIAGVNIGDLIKDQINSEGDGDLDFDTDVKPWLGENAGVFVQIDPNELVPGSDGITSYSEDSSEGYGLIVETTDTDAAKAFIDKQAESEGGATDGEYEGFSYKVAEDDGSAAGVVDDFVVIGSTEAGFKAAVDASKGDNLADTDAFSDLADKAAEGALATVFTTNEPYLAAMEQSGYDFSGLASALGVDLEGTGSVLSLVPEENQISLQGYSNSGSDLESGDPSPVIETFPANSLFAMGSGNVGENASRIMDALNEEGIPGLLEPGQVDEAIKGASGQIDVKGIIDSLETVAFFVSGSTEGNLGGALVATSSNIEPIESSLRGISSLIGLADDADVRPLPGDAVGFQVTTDDLPGRPIVIGVKDDRMVIGVGMRPSMIALNGSGQTLADYDVYRAAEASIPGEGLDLFADPAGIARLVRNLAAGDPDAQQIAGVIRKFEYMAAGSGADDDTFEFNLGLRE